MRSGFDVAGGTITGADHLRIGKNNQDAYTLSQTEKITVAIVNDGCGSGKHSEVGAKIASRVLAQLFVEYGERYADMVPVGSDTPARFPFWERILLQANATLGVLTRSMGGSFSQMVSDYFLFTTVGVLITPRDTFIFSIGDGMYAINGEVTHLGPFAGNAPPYLGYGLTGSTTPGEASEIKITCNAYLPTKDVESILVGSDGVDDLIALTGTELPRKSELIGGIDQFWRLDKYFKNPDMVRRRLAMVNAPSADVSSAGTHARFRWGLLRDDTTLVVARRRPVINEETKEASE